MRGWVRGGPVRVGALLVVALLVAGCLGRSPGGDTGGTRPPRPSPTPDPASSFVASLAAFPPATLAGNGAKTMPWPVPAGEPVLATVIAKGTKGDLAVTTLNADGSTQDLVLTATVPYQGTVLMALRATPASVRVAAAGAWSIRLEPVSEARAWDGTGTLAGSGDDVVVVQPSLESALTVVVTGTSPVAFTVVASTPTQDSLLVSEAGDFRGTVSLPADTVLLSVHASGRWTIVVK